jgi:hypothetical protein
MIDLEDFYNIDSVGCSFFLQDNDIMFCPTNIDGTPDYRELSINFVEDAEPAFDKNLIDDVAIVLHEMRTMSIYCECGENDNENCN